MKKIRLDRRISRGIWDEIVLLGLNLTAVFAVYFAFQTKSWVIPFIVGGLSATLTTFFLRLHEATKSAKRARGSYLRHQVLWLVVQNTITSKDEVDVQDETTRWLKTGLDVERIMMLVEAGIRAKDAENSEISSLTDEELTIMAALRSNQSLDDLC